MDDDDVSRRGTILRSAVWEFFLFVIYSCFTQKKKKKKEKIEEGGLNLE